MKESTILSYPVGTCASFDVHIDDELIDRFADVSGDHNPLHVDPEYGASTFLGGRVAHGMISGALFSRLVGEHLPGERALYRSQDIQFVRPIHPGTHVRVEGEVTAIDEELDVLTIATAVRDRDSGDAYVTGTAEVVLRKEQEEEDVDRPIANERAGLLQNRNVLIVGGSSGIGKAVTTEVAHAGARTTFSYRDRDDAAEQLRSRLNGDGAARVHTTRVDIGDVESLRSFADSHERIDGIVFVGFGSIAQKGITRGSSGDLVDAFQRAVVSTYELIQAALPRLSRGASIVMIGSTVTIEPPPPNWTAYTVAKSAQVGLMRSLAVELGPRGIRVNIVSPSLTGTERNRGLPPRILEDFEARSPLARIADPTDVARAVTFLLSDQSSFITGVSLPVAGGGVMS